MNEFYPNNYDISNYIHWIATGLGLMILFSATHFWLTTIKKERQKSLD
ncbi:hypothetical protein KF7HA_00995 [Lactococcus lactis]|nr:hypothetical protein [Lactococcus lactis]